MQPFDGPDEAEFRAEAQAWLSANATRLEGSQVSPSALVAEWSPDQERARIEGARAWQRTKFEAGWAGIAWPKAYGGRGGSTIEHVIFWQEEAGFDVPRDALVVGLGWCGPALMVHGTEVQKERLLRPLLGGDEVWCQLFSEPGAGSDLAGLATRARRDGDEWIISGQKVWTTFAHHSDWGLCIARHDPSLPKHAGLSAFIVDMKSPGVTARPLRQITGSANFNEVFLDQVRVPDSMRVGEVGDGWRVVITTFMFERLNAVISIRPILRALAELAHERGVAGDPQFRDRFARLAALEGALRFTGLRLLTSISRGGVPGPEGSILKLAGSLGLSNLFELAVDAMGAAGMLQGDEAPWAGEWVAAFLGAPGLRIGGGTDAVQRNIIGERVLGLPPDIRVDKGIPFEQVG